jgi:D-alanyl-D-alanine carboxypeptidase/D-alanyl-D-alanine-endopeptidase (penicillin-binding protein 4)
LAGVDGTMKNRKSAAHSAYVKTGYLSGVRALAGYVFAASGHRYVIVGFLNDPHADAAQGALDEFLQWVWQRG